MASKKQTGFVGLIRGVNERLEHAEEKLSELERESGHFAKGIEQRQVEIDELAASVGDCDKQVAELEARREILRNEYTEASFSGDAETQRAIQAERAAIDTQLEELQAKRGKAQAKRNRLESRIATTRENTWDALDAIEPPDDEQLAEVIAAVLDGIRAQRASILTRMETVERNLELPEGTIERVQAAKRAESQREAAEKAAERERLIEARDYYAKLLSNLNHLRGPHLGYKPWVKYLEDAGIEYRTESSGDSTFSGPNESGKTVRLDLNSIVADVRAAYIRTKGELGEEVDDSEFQESGNRQYRQTASHFTSVMG